MSDRPKEHSAVTNACEILNAAFSEKIVPILGRMRDEVLARLKPANQEDDTNTGNLFMKLNKEVICPAADNIEAVLRLIDETEENPLIHHYIAMIVHRIRKQLGTYNSLYKKVLEQTAKASELSELEHHFILNISPEALDLRTVDLEFVMLDAIETRASHKQNITFEHTLPQRTELLKGTVKPKLRVQGHREMLKEIFIELFQNAASAMPKGGKILIVTTETEDEITIQISDIGIGIATESITRIFDLGFTQTPAGTGKGLYYVKIYMEEYMRGSIEVESVEQKGTTFKLTFPKKP